MNEKVSFLLTKGYNTFIFQGQLCEWELPLFKFWDWRCDMFRQQWVKFLPLFVMVLVTFSACTGTTTTPAVTPTPDPASSPEMYVQKYAPNVAMDSLPDGSITASGSMVNDQAVAISIGITVYPEGKLPKLIAGEGGQPLDVARIGDQSVAYRTQATDSSTGNMSARGASTTVLDFTKGNTQVHLSAYPITGGDVAPEQLVSQAQQIEKELPAKLTLQPLPVPSTAQVNSFTFNEYIKSVELGKQVADGAVEITVTRLFATQDISHCLRFVFNKAPKTVILALFDEKQNAYISKSSSGLNSEEEKILQATRCIDRAGLAVGKYDLGVWVNNDFVSEYSFDVK
jgi:hypothetical protein